MGSHSSDEEALEVYSWRGLRLLSNPAGTASWVWPSTRATFHTELPVCLTPPPPSSWQSVQHASPAGYSSVSLRWRWRAQAGGLKCIYLSRSTRFLAGKAWRPGEVKGHRSREAESAQEPGVPIPNPEYSTTHALITHVRENAKEPLREVAQQKAPFPRNPAPHED